ncbi:MAG: hypothetical protein EOO61_06100 [Hymenobacter sp.]|nr:MAG: hypothetical protein EOO61_06100 [Hymenobacter sp.]
MNVTVRLKQNGGAFEVVKVGVMASGLVFYENYATNDSNVLEVGVTQADGQYLLIENGTLTGWN